MTDSKKQPDTSPSTESWLLDSLKKLYGIDEILKNLLEKIETGGEPDARALNTGFPKLNRALNGGLSGLTVIGGGPGVGKTTLALQLGVQIIEKENVPFIFVSMEMSRERLVARLLGLCCDMSMKEFFGGTIREGPNGQKMRDFVNKDKIKRYEQGRELLRALANKIFILDNTIIDSWLIFSEFGKVYLGLDDRIKHAMDVCKSNRAFVVIDHLQVFPLVEPYIDKESGGIKLRHKSVEERERLTILMDNFSRLQQTLDISLLLISQINRQARREGPGLTAFLGSSSIEYLVDVGMTLIDPEQMKKAKDDNGKKIGLGPNLAKKTSREPQEGRQVNLAILKNRDGLTGYIPLTFFPAVMRFVEP